MSAREERLRSRFESAGQGHVFGFWPELEAPAREKLLDQIDTIDLDLVRTLGDLIHTPHPVPSHVEFAPAEVFPLQRDARQAQLASAARRRGEELFRQGAVAYLLVAGGQASRLGYDGPKGAFPVGPVTERSLFEVFARRIHAAERRYAAPALWYILTSAANEADTRAFFAERAHFGLDPERVVFFRQGMAPALDPKGRLLMSTPGEIFMAPNGHGGVLAALASSGGLEHARERGVRCFSYFQVDNPLARPADPLFIGLHAGAGARMSSKVVSKRNAAEKVGVLGRVDGRLSCIEYSDLPEPLREARGPGGELLYGAGNIAVHVIDHAFVEQLTRGGLKLPWHVAKKNMAVVDREGGPVRIEGYKFETFVFDALQLAGKSVTLEVERSLEFSPIKNRSGEDSPATARADMCRLYAGWVREVGLPLPLADEAGLHAVEIDPCLAEDLEQWRRAGPLVPKVTARGHFYG
jgi:UDP-N-acetylglucosamine/UDP-N-acetylgalactosamine diphosphorylase